MGEASPWVLVNFTLFKRRVILWKQKQLLLIVILSVKNSQNACFPPPQSQTCILKTETL